MRKCEIDRNTRETQIRLSLELDGAQRGFIGTTGVGFFDHMLNSFAFHGGMRLEINMKGDLEVDAHHTVEDVGIALGCAFAKLLGDRSGIARFGEASVPMDEALAAAFVDISGRPYLVFDAGFTAGRIGEYDTQLTVEFFRALAFNMGATLHLRVLYGANDHHKTEALFKAAARAMSAAVSPAAGGTRSTKGVL